MNHKHKRPAAFFLYLAAAFPLFAQGAQGVLPSGMTSLAQSVLAIFTGDFVKAILAIFLSGSAVAYGFNKDNEKIKRSAIAVGVSAAILIGASSIVGKIWSASGG